MEKESKILRPRLPVPDYICKKNYIKNTIDDKVVVKWNKLKIEQIKLVESLTNRKRHILNDNNVKFKFKSHNFFNCQILFEVIDKIMNWYRLL